MEATHKKKMSRNRTSLLRNHEMSTEGKTYHVNESLLLAIPRFFFRFPKPAENC